VAGTFKNWYFEVMWPEENPSGGGWDEMTFTLLVNGSPSGLSVTVPAAAPATPPPGYLQFASNTTDTATIAPGDIVTIDRGVGHVNVGINSFTALFAWTLTFESDNDGESSYGGCHSANASLVPPASTGTVQATNLLLSAPFTGPTDWATASPGDAGTFSVVPLNGAVTRLDVNIDIPPGMGITRTFAAYLNEILQDGSGGTVDTRVTISGSATSAFGTFTLPIAVLDRLSIAQLVTAGTQPTASYLTYSIAVTADIDGQSALGYNTGSANPIVDGSTDFAVGNDGGWAWSTARSPAPNTNDPNRWPFSEYSMSIPGPIDSYSLSGLCMQFNSAPGTAKSYTFTTRKNFADTPATVTLSDADLVAVGSDAVATYTSVADRLALKGIASDTPSTTRTSWTWLVTEATVPPIVSTSYPIRRLRRFALPFAQNQWIRISRVELIMQAGNGLSGTVATQGYNPIVMFRLSRDGGATWDDELQMATGKIGAYTARAYLNRLGRARNPVVELTSSDPVFVSWIDFTVDYEVGTS
jgi:hypothetical protein